MVLEKVPDFRLNVLLALGFYDGFIARSNPLRLVLLLLLLVLLAVPVRNGRAAGHAV
jgi:hypothetical protein